MKLSASSSAVVDQLLNGLDTGMNETFVTERIKQLEDLPQDEVPEEEDNSRFDKLVGLYDVSFTKVQRAGENPVGGKWTRQNGLAQKLLRTRRTFQHILPVNSTGCGALKRRSDDADRTVVGEAVNVVSLEALFGIIRVTVILRGDAVPLTFSERTNTSKVFQDLTPLAVKALFDAPRIVFGRRGRVFNINVGPRTDVLLDTTYCDEKVRIGMGGTSGTRFVFRRCPDEDDAEANEFRALLSRKPTPKRKALIAFGTLASLGLYGAVFKRLRLLGGFTTMVSCLFGALIAFSSGGIERDELPSEA